MLCLVLKLPSLVVPNVDACACECDAQAFWLDTVFHLLPEPLRSDVEPSLNVFLASPIQERLDKNKKRLAAIMARMNLHCFDDNVEEFLSCSSVEDFTDRSQFTLARVHADTLHLHRKGSGYANMPTDTSQECALKCTRDRRCEAWSVAPSCVL